MRNNLSTKTTDQLIWVRSFNNTYAMFCKKINSKQHRFYTKIVYPTISDWIVSNTIDRSDWEDWWLKKSSQRMKKLETEKRIQLEPLFHESMSERDLENWLSSRGVK